MKNMAISNIFQNSKKMSGISIGFPIVKILGPEKVRNFKSISGLHCDFKCEISSIESPARGSYTWYKYAYSVFGCGVKSLAWCFNGFSYVLGQHGF